jgi:hypothetical protein
MPTRLSGQQAAHRPGPGWLEPESTRAHRGAQRRASSPQAMEGLRCGVAHVPWPCAPALGSRPHGLWWALPRSEADGDARHRPRRTPPAWAERLERSDGGSRSPHGGIKMIGRQLGPSERGSHCEKASGGLARTQEPLKEEGAFSSGGSWDPRRAQCCKRRWGVPVLAPLLRVRLLPV